MDLALFSNQDIFALFEKAKQARRILKFSTKEKRLRRV